jgi:hypothetical protein
MWDIFVVMGLDTVKCPSDIVFNMDVENERTSLLRCSHPPFDKQRRVASPSAQITDFDKLPPDPDALVPKIVFDSFRESSQHPIFKEERDVLKWVAWNKISLIFIALHLFIAFLRLALQKL